MFITNTAGASAKFSFFADNNGTTYDETTAIIWEVELSNNESFIINVKFLMKNQIKKYEQMYLDILKK